MHSTSATSTPTPAQRSDPSRPAPHPPRPSCTASLRAALGRRFPLTGVLHPRGPSEIWFKHACSVVVATAIPNLALLAFGRPDLIMYTMAGSLCALYAHNRPYAARARTLALVVAGMLATMAICLVTASLTRQAVLLVTVGAALAAVQKAVLDAARTGPPGHVIYVFIGSATLFAPQHIGQVPGHLALTAAAGLISWCVGMAPALLSPHGPERRAVAAALEAASEHAATRGTGPGHEATRVAAARAVHTAWEALGWSGAGERLRRALEVLVVRAEVALAAPAASDPLRLRAWAGRVRGRGPVPHPTDLDGTAAREALAAAAATTAPGRPLRRALAPGSPQLPVVLRTFVGCALAGLGALACGVDRPYWALVTAAALYQANITLTWTRTVQRVVGNIAGVLVFAAVVPLAHLGPPALVLCCLAFAFGAEALISRNYWLGTMCVTPMALLVTEFARPQQATALMTGRLVDTLIGAVLGLAAALAVTNRRAATRAEGALAALEAATEHAGHLLAAGVTDSAALERARRRLTAALTDLRAAAEAAAGEWHRHAAPDRDRMARARRAGHRTLAATLRRQGLHAWEDAQP